MVNKKYIYIIIIFEEFLWKNIVWNIISFILGSNLFKLTTLYMHMLVKNYVCGYVFYRVSQWIQLQSAERNFMKQDSLKLKQLL